MFGLEKDNKEPVLPFDLEKDLKDRKKQSEYVKHCEKSIQAIKTQLREGAPEEVFESLGLMLHGYSALLKILTDEKH